MDLVNLSLKGIAMMVWMETMHSQAAWTPFIKVHLYSYCYCQESNLPEIKTNATSLEDANTNGKLTTLLPSRSSKIIVIGI